MQPNGPQMPYQGQPPQAQPGMPMQPMPGQMPPVQPGAPAGVPPQPGAPGQPVQTVAVAAAQTANPSSAQSSLQLSEIRDNMVIMVDGSFRAVVSCKSINFDLMSPPEREGVEYAYQNFLNSLNHPTQIIIRSQRVDIGPYIDKLLDFRRNEDNMLLNVLMDDYINFIDILAQEANIMDKSFFIVVPYYPAGDLANLKDQTKGFFGKMFSKAPSVSRIDKATYEKAKDEIKNRVDGVVSGLFQMGIQSVQLNTKELGQLYYNFYNPDTAVREPLGNFNEVTAMYVRRGIGQRPAARGQGDLNG